MKIEKLTYEDFIGEYVIIRTYSAGVHLGFLSSYNETSKDAVLVNARMLWSWQGALALSDVASQGINFEKSKLTNIVDKRLLSNVIEIISIDEKLKEKFQNAKAESF
jgi:hypothetical protein